MSRKKKLAITRREFVKQSVGASLAAATAGCSSLPFREIASVDVETEYDYIVVGSGAGGGPVAFNLAKNGKLVLLIEAGGKTDRGYRNYDVPTLHPKAVDDPNMSWEFYVNHYKDLKKQAADSKYQIGKGVLYPRAATVGGCTAHNAMIALYPDNKDWDDIATALKDPSWNGIAMRDHYRKLTDPKHGWLSLEQLDVQARLKDWDWKLHSLAIAAAGGRFEGDVSRLAFIGDPNTSHYVGNKKDGAYNIPMTTAGGLRFGPRELIERGLTEFPERLQLMTNSLVTKVLLDGTTALGVEFLEGASVYRADTRSTAQTINSAVLRRAKLKKGGEVILSGGAFNTPQLLMLSGVGPGLKIDLPGVGQNLQDRYEFGVVTELTSDIKALARCNFGEGSDPCLEEFDKSPRTSIYSSNGPIVSMLYRSDNTQPNPDLAIFALPVYFRGYYPKWSNDCFRHNYMTWAVLKGHTQNTGGTVTLRSDKPWDPPEINFNYFPLDAADPDLKAILRGIEIARGINRKSYIRKFIKNEELPAQNGEALADLVRREAWGHHASCTAKIGADDDKMAVLDNKFRVRGTTGLRVVDASVFPRLPGLFLALPIYMVAQKASEDILKGT